EHLAGVPGRRSQRVAGREAERAGDLRPHHGGGLPRRSPAPRLRLPRADGVRRCGALLSRARAPGGAGRRGDVRGGRRDHGPRHPAGRVRHRQPGVRDGRRAVPARGDVPLHREHRRRRGARDAVPGAVGRERSHDEL
ncbi:MAG: hypothetical protein AVDCRST_MAG68-1520, partial [uncultured Gemmatimonadetes bacterium]